MGEIEGYKERGVKERGRVIVRRVERGKRERNRKKRKIGRQTLRERERETKIDEEYGEKERIRGREKRKTEG